MKKFLMMLMVITILSVSSVMASQEVIEVKLNDKYIDFTDEKGNKVEPALINDRTMVPMRKIFETLGASIEWDGALRKVTATTEDKKISLQIENENATIENLETNETKNIKLDSAPVILNERTMVPVRFIAEALDKQVGWDAENRVVVIIDYTDVIKTVEEKCSNIIAMKKEQTVEIDTWELTAKINGTLDYKDKDSSKNNQNLKLTGTVEYKKGDEAGEIDIALKTTGSGELKNLLKENGYDNYTVNMIADFENDVTYTKTSITDEYTKGKWVKTEGQTLGEMTLNSLQVVKQEPTELLKLDENNLTKDSYEELLTTVEALVNVYGDDNVKVSGTKEKTYTIQIDAREIISKYANSISDNLKELLDEGSITAEMKNSYKNGMNTKSSISVTVSIRNKESKENINLKFNIEAKFDSYNKSVDITIPKASKIYEG